MYPSLVSISGVLSSPLNLDVVLPQGSILGPLLFSIYINDLPLLLKDTEVDIYADDTTIWSNRTNCIDIQNTLNDSLDKANSWFKLNRMIPNTKKTKHLLVGSVQKLNHSSETIMEIYIDNIKLEEAAGEKLLGVVIDSNLSWNLHNHYLIKKLNSRICLLKRAKAYLTFACRKMLYNALIKPMLEYCSTVWGNCTVDNLQRVLRLQKRCARLFLDADTQENSVKLFNKLDWLPIDDIIRIRKLCMLHKINQRHCPAYFNNYIEYISNTHNYNTRSVSNNNITTPACKRNSGLKTFHSSACRLWNTLDAKLGSLSYSDFKNYLFKLYRSRNSFIDHFKICKTF